MADAKPDVSVVPGDPEENLRRAALAQGDDAVLLHEAVFESAGAAPKLREASVLALAGLYAQLGQADKLAALLERAKPLFAELPKARTAKVVRTLIDHVAAVPGDTLELQEKLCNECIAWADAEKRRYLRQRLQGRLAAIQLKRGQFDEAIRGLEVLMREVKQLDDKQLLVELHLVESQIHHKLRNLPRAKASLTAARANANAIYMTPELQAKIDEQAGILQADSKDFKTAYSYFFEAFEAHDEKSGSKRAAAASAAMRERKASQCLKYMLLCKVMMGKASDVESIVSGKVALKHEGRNIDSIRAVAKAYKDRSLHELETALKDYTAELMDDDLIRSHLETLTETLLEENLLRLIEPYSCVEIQHLADLIKLPLARVEHKLSQMILDKKLNGILDQGRGQLIIREVLDESRSFSEGLSVIKHMGSVVDSLFVRTQNLRI